MHGTMNVKFIVALLLGLRGYDWVRIAPDVPNVTGIPR